MSVSLTPPKYHLTPEDDNLPEAELDKKIDEKSQASVDISNGEWKAVVAACRAFGIEVPEFKSHDPYLYSPEILAEMSVRMKQLSAAHEYLDYLAKEGGAWIS